MKRFAGLGAIFVSQLASPVAAAPADLDPSFGGGVVLRAVGPYFDVGTGCALQPDGALLVGGRTAIVSNQSNTDFGLIRHNANSTPDTSFGPGTGAVVTPVQPYFDTIQSLALRPDGRILAGGMVMAATTTYFGLVRYLGNGSLDTSFGAGTGKVSTNFSTSAGSNAYGFALALQPDGKVVMVGDSSDTANPGTGADLTIFRYNDDGSLDSGFGTGGKARVSASSANDTAEAVALQADGRIVVAGRAAGFQAIVIARLTSAGAPDSAFGSGGKVLLNLSATMNAAYAVAVQPDGKIVAVGSVGRDLAGNRDLVVLRFTSSGVLDTSFNGTGQVRYAPVKGVAEGRSIAILPTGEILVAGTAPYGAGTQQFLVVRYTPNGQPDLSFANGQAHILTPVLNAPTLARSLCVSPTGKFYVSGYSGGYYAIAAYQGTPQDVTPDGISFASVIGVAPLSQQTSSPIVVSGLDAGVQVAVLVSNGDYSMNGGPYSSAPGWATNADTITVRHTAAATPGTSAITTLQVGGLSPTNNPGLALGATALATFTSTTF